MMQSIHLGSRAGALVACLALAGLAEGADVARQVRRGDLFQAAYARLDHTSTERAVSVALPLSLSVGLMVEQTRITASGSGPVRVSVGGKSFAAAAGEKWTAKRLAGTAAAIEYLPVIRTFPFEEEAQARQLSQQWASQGHPSEAMLVGIQLIADGAGINDSRRWYVMVGKFTDLPAAQEFIAHLLTLGEKPWMYERVRQAAAGEMALVDPQGRERGRGPSVTWEPLPLRDGTPSFIKVAAVHHDVGFPTEGTEDRRYEGAISALFDKKGLLAAVNVIELEVYLKGVVPSEIYASDPMDTIKAQACAARGETLSVLGLSSTGQPYDICSDQNCQVYTGIERHHPRTTEGVLATRGQVLRRQGKIVKAVYADTCGGHTENVENVWSSPPDPTLVGKPDCLEGQSTFPSPLTEASLRAWLESNPPTLCRGPDSSLNAKHRWTVTLTTAELSERINKKHAVGTVRQLIPVQRGVSGRLKYLKVVGTKATVTLFKELPIRQALGGFKSALFVVTPLPAGAAQPTTWRFQGAGWGHGVGMCQVGARFAAQSGMDYKAILSHYFSESQVELVYE